jgi:hypothetical protein
MRHRRRHTRHWRGCSLFPLRNRLQHISRPGDVRQVNLGFDFVFATQIAGGSRRGSRFRGRTEVHPYFFCFEVFQRTGMGLLLGHPDCLQDIENSLAFNFQLPGEIVDSNLAHPAFLASACAQVFI